jgi:large subunit ribosomal protein L19
VLEWFGILNLKLLWSMDAERWSFSPLAFRPLLINRNARAISAGDTMSTIIDTIEKEQQKTDLTTFKVGDGVRVHTRIKEGDKERIQIFSGIVIGRKGRGINETFTVRRISYGEGVERVFPLHSPRIAKLEVEKVGKARRAKLNYLRDRKGKEATAVRE